MFEADEERLRSDFSVTERPTCNCTVSRSWERSRLEEESFVVDSDYNVVAEAPVRKIKILRYRPENRCAKPCSRGFLTSFSSPGSIISIRITHLIV